VASRVNSPPHILVVSKTFPPFWFPESHVTAKLVSSFLEAGAPVTVITSDEWGNDCRGLAALMTHPRLAVLRTKAYANPLVEVPLHLMSALLERTPIDLAHFVSACLSHFCQH
jgi:hypothetical protein